MINIEILNKEITMRKHCQDALELSLHVCPNPSMTKNMEFSRYVESDVFACAYFDYPLELGIKNIPVRGLYYFLEDSNNSIVYCKGPILSGLNTQKDNLRNMEERFTYDRLYYQIIR